MRLTAYTLDQYFSQKISELTEFNAPDLSKEFDQAEYWVNNFILNSFLRVEIEPKLKPFIFGILRRVQMALVEYRDGQTALVDYLSGQKQRISPYFRALYHFELVVMLLYQAYDYERKVTGTDHFKSNDGSPLDRLHLIYNDIKHPGKPSEIKEGYLHIVWLTNMGIESMRAALSWQELAELIKREGRFADVLSNPPSAAKKEVDT